MWKNVAKPIISNNKNKYLEYLTTEEINIFERIAGKMLSTLGYSPISASELNSHEFTNEQIQHFDELNRQGINKVVAGISEHDLKLRKAQKEVLESIKNKLDIV